MNTLGDLALACGKRFAGHAALRCGSDMLTHDRLAHRVARLAASLRASPGVAMGDRVAVLGADRIETLEMLLACGVAGLIAVLVNAQLQRPEIEHILTDSGARIFVLPVDRSDTIAQVEGRVAALQYGVQWGSASPYELKVSGASPMISAAAVPPDSVAMIAYTSGTTGAPKGVAISHRALLAAARIGGPVSCNIVPFGRAVLFGSLSFAPIIWAFVFSHLAVGGSVRILGRPPFENWIERLIEDRATWTYSPSPLLMKFASALKDRASILEYLTAVVHGGSSVPREDRQALYEASKGRFFEIWGMTEAAGSVSSMTPTDYVTNATASPFDSVGRALPTCTVTARAEDGSILPAGEIGELWVCGETVFSGYWGQPTKTAEVMSQENYKTGDLGYLDAAGYIYLTGRMREMIISGGIKIYPAEVERVLLAMESIAECAVIGTASQRWGEAVTAVVVRRVKSLNAEDVIHFCRDKLASFKRPKRVVFVDNLPRSASLKVRKHEVAKQFIDYRWNDSN